MRLFFLPLITVSGVILAACSPAVPESGPTGGVGFGNYQSYLKQREAALQNGTAIPSAGTSQATVANAGAAIGAEPIAATSLGGTSPSAPLPASILAAVPGASGSTTSTPYGQTTSYGETTSYGQTLSAPLGAQTTSSLPAAAPVTSQIAAAPVPANTPGISDENSFDAVAGRESIASDKARLAEMRANYQQITPTNLPERTGDTGPNLASYALSASNTLGQSVYSRGGMHLTSNERACRKYASADKAQIAFLEAGGPQKDGKNLDPDGDGFACSWDPRPFQAARAQ